KSWGRGSVGRAPSAPGRGRREARRRPRRLEATLCRRARAGRDPELGSRGPSGAVLLCRRCVARVARGDAEPFPGATGPSDEGAGALSGALPFLRRHQDVSAGRARKGCRRLVRGRSMRLWPSFQRGPLRFSGRVTTAAPVARAGKNSMSIRRIDDGRSRAVDRAKSVAIRAEILLSADVEVTARGRVRATLTSTMRPLLMPLAERVGRRALWRRGAKSQWLMTRYGRMHCYDAPG